MRRSIRRCRRWVGRHRRRFDAAGTGFVAERATAHDLLAALIRAERRVRDRRRRTAMRKRIMAIDWSWESPALEYLALYREMIAGV